MPRILRVLCAAVMLVTAIHVPVMADGKFDLPASEEGLPGEGALRRYDGYVKTWARSRAAWSKRVEQDQNSVVFLGDF